MLNGKSILITGGTGSFGKKCTEIILKRYKPEKLIIFSRDELKQFEMAQVFSEKEYPCIRYFIGDVRDKDRLYRVFDGVDYVIHAAALKQIPAAERNPFEVINTNIVGAENIINAAIDREVKKVIALSTDKAANPINLYGATKLCSDKLFISGNSYSGWHGSRFSVVRYGNVIGSRGSVIPFFTKMKETGTIPITDPGMTRFWITLEQGVEFVIKCLDMCVGGELLVPKIPSMNIMDLAKAIAPDCEYQTIGIRPGEKLHEEMITVDDSRHTLEFDEYYVVEPEFDWWINERHRSDGGKAVKEGFRYASNLNDKWLTIEELRSLANIT
ncbi:MAG: UDP-N-acetylglucosamine 4,6-dehydratase (inverting) [Candidatus Scalindua rubra]|uniref:Polysaccharide biosynthesis protein n=1 Tax=Candidatus Scalindua brodae TaxID=237368 RepID=A0A0B0EIV1_9BACT|nr:MAG: polysaccharide biosynthesis protein [Candidatus Scalindua brodae]MBZ0109635.1 UDP-N-acetylglucosamine 4,6-dehydratase (inverting) [Candidatus Scalindua rubra]TWU33110.1 UDP-N-acetylglucosamine 4,6-dehydratase (inverting) [Candidatus Brocadiaceae bacterium S225]